MGPGLAAGLHAHHAVQVCLPLSGPVRLRSSPGARWGSYDGAVIPSDVPHESDTPVARLVTLWLDAETPEARRLVEPGRHAIVAIQASRLRVIVPPVRAWWEDLHDGQQATSLLEEVVRALAPCEHPSGPLDLRVARAREFLQSAPHAPPEALRPGGSSLAVSEPTRPSPPSATRAPGPPLSALAAAA